MHMCVFEFYVHVCVCVWCYGETGELIAFILPTATGACIVEYH